MINSKTELVERRLIHFELFFQTVVMNKQVQNVLQFLWLKSDGTQMDKQKFVLFMPNRKKLSLMINEVTTAWEILRRLNSKYNNLFIDVDNYALVFFHKKHGEKILDEFECPI